MNQQIDDLNLIKFLGKGAYGEVYLSEKKNSNKLFATKKISREVADRPKFKKYLINEIEILKLLNHPNIVKFEDFKKSSNSYFIVMEYINGGGLSDCLKKYMQKYGKAFPEQIVQYLMRQIIDALVYIHDKKIIHRDLKLDNIMVHFDSEIDKQNLNMMKAKIKIIDFGFSILLTKQNLASTMVGSPINMDPIILEKYNKLRDKSATYDNKVDIWSIGTVCYELLIGKAVFDATTMGSLVEKVREGSYRIPSTVSREIVSFLNDMLQYDPNNRLSAKQLQKHPFLVKDVKDFTYMNAERTTKDDKIKKNKSIWAVFKDEEKFINIKDNHNTNQNQNPIPEESKIGKEYQTKNVNHNHHHNNNMKQYKRSNTMTPQQNIYSFYGQQMTLNSPQQNTGYYPQTIQYNNIPQYTYNNTHPTFGVPLTYGYAQYNTQNQIQNIQNQGINYIYQNNNNAVDHQLRRAQSNYVIHPKTKKKVKEGGCFIF